MRTELITGEQAFEQLAGEWDELLSRSMTNTPFQTHAYQKAWWRHLQPDGSQLITVITRDDSGTTLGIGCFFQHNDALHFNGCIEESDYLDLIAPADSAEVVWRETLRCINAAGEGLGQRFDLCNIPQTSPTRQILPTVARQLNYVTQETQIEVCPIIALPETFEAYLDTLDSKQRREISRKLRRSEAADVDTKIVDSSDSLATEVDSFLDLLQKSTFEKRDWLNEGRRALFHDVAQAAQSKGNLQIMFTVIEGRRAAALFNFDYQDRIWVYNSGLDPTAFAALSPGVVLTATAIEAAIKLGRQEFDFLRGDEEYKYRFGAVDAPIYRHVLERTDHE